MDALRPPAAFRYITLLNIRATMNEHRPDPDWGQRQAVELPFKVLTSILSTAEREEAWALKEKGAENKEVYVRKQRRGCGLRRRMQIYCTSRTNLI